MRKHKSLKIVGPVYGGKNAEAVAYTVVGNSQGRQHTVCMVAQNTPLWRKRLTRNLETFFEMALSMARQKLVAWKEIPCFILILQLRNREERGQIHFVAYRTRKTMPRKLAQEVLSSIYIASWHETNTITFQLAKELIPLPESGFSSYIVESDEDPVGFSALVKDEGALEDLLTDFSHLQPAIQEINKQLYMEEILGYLATNRPVLAFCSFSHYSGLIDSFNTQEFETLFQLGTSLIEYLMQTHLYDYAEWVAGTIAHHAERASRPLQVVQGLRQAAIACEATGYVEMTKIYYERALSYHDQLSDRRELAKLHMSYGISMLILTSHMETEPSLDLIAQAPWKDLLDTARLQLSIAQQIYESFTDEWARWSRCAIALDLIRLDDLDGQHKHALNTLQSLVESEQLVMEPKLLATVLLYRCAICKKLADGDDAWRGAYYASLNEAAEAFEQTQNFEGKRAIFYTFLGEALQKNGQLEEAVGALEVAYELQQVYARYAIRPPKPDTLYGGLLAIDICGKLQYALHQLPEVRSIATTHTSSRLRALLFADHAKGRFFQRDLTFLTFTPEQRLSPLLSLRDTRLRHAIARGEINHCIMMADYERFLAQDIPSKSAKQFLYDVQQDVFPTPDDIEALWATIDGKAILISLYTVADGTYVYAFKETMEEPHLFKIDMNLQQLQKVVTDLQWGISGRGLRPHIDPQHPERNQRFFTSLLALGEQFSPLVSLLVDIDVILLSPHGLWHNLPLHLFLLPPLWKAGHNPGLVYLPSIRLYHHLRRRAAEQQIFQLKSIGLTTAYASNNTRDLFEQAHRDFVKIFERSGMNVLATLGDQASEANLFDGLQRVSLYHVLAHGCYERDSDPMHSSLLLADTDGIPVFDQRQGKIIRGAIVAASALMAYGTTAQHITIQACSLGRSRSSYGDEFWGMSRALIAAGANSVLAPLWDIQPASSTRLLQLFYERWLINKQPKWRAWADAQYVFYATQEQQAWQHFFHWAAFRLIGY